MPSRFARKRSVQAPIALPQSIWAKRSGERGRFGAPVSAPPLRLCRHPHPPRGGADMTAVLVSLYVDGFAQGAQHVTLRKLGQPERGNVQRFRGGLVFKAHRLLYRSTPGSIVIQKKKRHVTLRIVGQPERGRARALTRVGRACGQFYICDCRGTSLIRNSTPLGPYSRTMPMALGGPYGGGSISDERGNPIVADKWMFS